VTATPANSPGPGPGRPNTDLGRGRVALFSYTQGALHNLNVDVSWVEEGDVIEVTTQGLSVAEAERFTEGLVRTTPPFRSAATSPPGEGTTTSLP
jgi:hypothetical protein